MDNSNRQLIQARFEKIKLILHNIRILNGENVSLIGKSKIFNSPHYYTLEEYDFDMKIGFETTEPEEIAKKSALILNKFNFEPIFDEESMSIRMTYDDKDEKFDVYLYFSNSIKLLDWLYLYGYETEFDYGDKIALLKAVSDFYPLHIHSWYDTNYFIVESYKVYQFRPEYGLVEKIYSFKSKNGFLKKAKPIKELTKINTYDPKIILKTIFGTPEAQYCKTVESLLEILENKDFFLYKRKNEILKRFNEYRNTKTKISFEI